MSDQNLNSCKHDKCTEPIYDPSMWQLRYHHRKRDLHPCCEEDGNLCNVGKSFDNSKNSWYKKSSSSPQKLVACSHTDCGKRYASYQSRSNHHKDHIKCSSPCTKCCSPAVPVYTLEPLPTLPSKRDFLEDFKDNAVIADVKDAGSKLLPGDSVVLTKEGDEWYFSTLGEQVDAAFTDIMQKLKKAKVELSLGLLDWIKKNTSISRLVDADEEEALKYFAENAHIIAGLKEYPCLDRILSLPSIKALTRLKDVMEVSDKNWVEFDKALNVPKGFKISSIKRCRRKMTEDLVLTETPGGRGIERELLQTVSTAIRREYLSRKDPPVLKKSDEGFPIVKVKVGLDEGKICKRRNLMITTMDILSAKSVSQCKSTSDTYIINLYLAKPGEGSAEKSEFIEEECANLFDSLERLKKDPYIIIDNVKYKLELTICVDLACMVKLLGLKQVYNHQCKYRCPYCNVSNDDIGDFTVESYDFRNLQDMTKLAREKFYQKNSGTKLASCTRKSKSDLFGLCDVPLLKEMDIEDLNPCLVHALMSQCKLLRAHLWSEVQHQYVPKTLFWESIGKFVKLPDKPIDELAPEDIKVNRSETLKIFQNPEIMLHCLDSISTNLYIKTLRVWEMMYCLFVVAADPPEDFTEKEWRQKAKLMACLFVELFLKECVTTYMHIFVYHFGFFIEKHKGLESVSNYSTEGTVFICKKYIKNSGNKFGGVQGYLGTLITTSNSTRSWFTADIVQRDTEFRGIIWKEDEDSILAWRSKIFAKLMETTKIQ
mmetsp:Transcript_9911/g.16963  ORF Transcript_9911/g.16963 Transcript_9911/m.16963 type:complete len:768 (-) Transcript_9911:639-2942(-)